MAKVINFSDSILIKSSFFCPSLIKNSDSGNKSAPVRVYRE